MVARRQEQLFSNTVSTCYMILYCLFYLILRSQQTQYSSQIKSSYKKKCGRYRKVTSQVKNKCESKTYLWSHHFFATSTTQLPKSGQSFFFLQVGSPQEKITPDLQICVCKQWLWFQCHCLHMLKLCRTVNTEFLSPSWAIEPGLIPVLKYLLKCLLNFQSVSNIYEVSTTTHVWN